jgi:hypothetical protein
MTDVTLKLSESQVLTLLRQLSLKARGWLFQMLIADPAFPWDDADEAGPLDASLDGDDLWLESLDEPVEGWGIPDFWAERRDVTRRQLLAAETFHYSYAYYADHLGGDVRFDDLMPDDVDTLERAERENWDDARVAAALEIEEKDAGFRRECYKRAKAIIDAPTPAEAFRRGVRFSIEDAVVEGFSGEETIEDLVVQVCYRAADLGFLLDRTGLRLSDYSEELREE